MGRFLFACWERWRSVWRVICARSAASTMSASATVCCCGGTMRSDGGRQAAGGVEHIYRTVPGGRGATGEIAACRAASDGRARAYQAEMVKPPLGFDVMNVTSCSSVSEVTFPSHGSVTLYLSHPPLTAVTAM